MTSLVTVYRKPIEICRKVRRSFGETATTATEISSFAEEQKRAIEAELAKLRLTLRRATLGDMTTLCELQREAFPNFRPEQLMNDQMLYRIIEFGDPVVVSDAAGKLLGYHLVLNVDAKQRTAVSCGLVVHHSLKGLGLGTLLYRHSALRSMAAGGRALRGTVKSTNFSSLAVLLNKVGSICDRFYPRLGACRDPRLGHYCELSPTGLRRNRLDLEKLVDFAQSSRPGTDYQLVAPDDFENLGRMYSQTTLRIAAVVPPGLLAEQTLLFALPLERLRAHRTELTQGTP